MMLDRVLHELRQNNKHKVSLQANVPCPNVPRRSKGRTGRDVSPPHSIPGRPEGEGSTATATTGCCARTPREDPSAAWRGVGRRLIARLARRGTSADAMSA